MPAREEPVRAESVTKVIHVVAEEIHINARSYAAASAYLQTLHESSRNSGVQHSLARISHLCQLVDSPESTRKQIPARAEEFVQSLSQKK